MHGEYPPLEGNPIEVKKIPVGEHEISLWKRVGHSMWEFAGWSAKCKLCGHPLVNGSDCYGDLLKLQPLPHKSLRSWRSWVYYGLHGLVWITSVVQSQIVSRSDDLCWRSLAKLKRGQSYVLTAKNYGEVPEPHLPNTETHEVETKRWRRRRK